MNSVLTGALERVSFDHDPLQFMLIESIYQPMISFFHMADIVKTHSELEGVPGYTSAIAIELRGGPVPTIGTSPASSSGTVPIPRLFIHISISGYRRDIKMILTPPEINEFIEHEEEEEWGFFKASVGEEQPPAREGRGGNAVSSEIERLVYMTPVTIMISLEGLSWAGGAVAVLSSMADLLITGAEGGFRSMKSSDQ